ncbi:hypothetical protein K5D43_07470 [Pseudomonas cichorii]|nr:hypothetical protein [Pseudomonas cichorii]MBX8554318.1 hypothetical protein [Pseudomonas cichorii]
MQKPPSLPTVTVQARITRWRESEKGRYGLAEILTPDSPTEKAFFAISEHQTEPELDESFECLIRLVSSRWRVVRMACDEPPPVLELSGTVVELLEQRGLPAWKVRLELADGEVRYARLPSKCLDSAYLVWLEPGEQVRVRVTLPSQGLGEVEALLGPTASSTLAPDTDHPAKGYLAVALQDWHADGEKKPKSLRFALCVPGAGAWPLIWVKPSFLRSQGIRSVERVSLKEGFDLEAAHERLEDAAMVLQAGDREELADLVVDVIRMEVVFDARALRWSFQRLRAPLSLREPEEDGESVDWVRACVCGIEDKTPVTNKEDGLEPAAESVTRTPTTRISMEINDPRLGRGRVNGFLSVDIVRQAALDEGVQTIVRLVSNKSYWNIKALHRSTPRRDDV